MTATGSLMRISIALCLVFSVAGPADSGSTPLKTLADPCAQPLPTNQKTASSYIPCPPPPPPPPTCSGTAGQWAGCRGNGCAVCSELVAEYPLYFDNHPLCSPNDTCAGQYYTCNAACPAPTPDDLCDEPGDVNLNGIVEIADAVLLNNFLGCLTELTAAEIANSDVNGDCLVDQADANCLMDPYCVIQDCACAAPEVTSCRCSLPGDVNLNGIVEIADAVLLNNFLGCLTDLTAEQITNSDVNGDCLVDQADADCLSDPYCDPGVCVCGEPEVTGCRCRLAGDVNLNGIVEIADAVLLNGFLDCQANLTPDQIINSDVNGDCLVDQADANCLMDPYCEPGACVCTDPEYPVFSPGDTNSNGIVAEIGDVIYLGNFLCSGGSAPDPLANGDVDGDCDIDQADYDTLLSIVVDGGQPAECACGLPTVYYCE